MTVPAVSPSTSNSTSQTSSTSKTTVDYDSFLKLLVAEMKNQDPTKPMESTDFVAQLATFSQVEQTVQSNTKLDQILQATSLTQADSLIGREITSADGTATGVVSQVNINADGIIAVLQDGSQVTIGDGISIKAGN
jgi:flagellar basal-body rod modification protein FlgD